MAHWRSSLLVALIWALVYLPGLFAPEFKGEEPRRAIIAHEMIQSGDWMQPHIAGEIYDRKPPLFNWLIASSWIVGGSESEGLARLPSALSMLALALVALSLMRRMVDNQTGLFTALMILLNPGCWEKGRLAEIEALYCASYGVALLLWLYGSRRGGKIRIGCWLGSGAALGVGMMAKGPVPLVWFMWLFPLVMMFHERRWKRFLRCEWLWVMVPMLALGLPWFLWSARQGEAELVSGSGEGAATTWRSELLERVVPGKGWSPLDSIEVFFEGLINFMPWTLLLIPILVPSLRRRFKLGVQRERFAAAWGLALIVAYVPIALLPGSNGRYTMPLTVPAAVLVAIVYSASPVWVHLQRTRMIWIRTLEVLRWVAWPVMGLLLLLPIVVMPEQIDWHLLWWALGAAVLTLACQLISRLHEAVRWTPLVTATGLLFGGLVCGYASILTTVGRGSDHLRGMAAEINMARLDSEQVWLYRFNFKGKEGWLHYLDGERRYLPERKFDPEELGTGVVEIITSASRWEDDWQDLVEKLGEPSAVQSFRSGSQLSRPWVLVSFGGRDSPTDHRTWSGLAREHQQGAWLPPSEGSLREMRDQAEAAIKDEDALELKEKANEN